MPINGPKESITRVDEIAAKFSAEDAAIIRFSAHLTLLSGEVTATHIDALRDVGFDDRAVHDIVMVVACFAFMNRLADGTGVTLGADRHALARELFGAEALTAHLAWAEGT
jgi:alkylhydroperoxidase family enzyme